MVVLRGVGLGASLLLVAATAWGQNLPTDVPSGTEGWAAKRSEADAGRLRALPQYAAIEAELRSVVLNKSRLELAGEASSQIMNGQLYEFARTASSETGIWRRTSLQSFLGGAPRWETVLDLASLRGYSPGRELLAHAVKCAPPHFTRCMVPISKGSISTAEFREFDLASKAFVKDGFRVPLTLGGTLEWIDQDRLLVSVDGAIAPPAGLGRPNVIKLWRRGQSLANASVILRGSDPSTGFTVVGAIDSPKSGRLFLLSQAERASRVYRRSIYAGDRVIPVAIPLSASVVGTSLGQLILSLPRQSDVSGAAPAPGVYSTSIVGLRSGKVQLKPLYLAAAGDNEWDAIAGPSGVLVILRDPLRPKMILNHLAGGRWTRREIRPPLPGTLTRSRITPDPRSGTDYAFVTAEDRTLPKTLFSVELKNGATRVLERSPASFDATNLVSEEAWATSRDGVRVPYTVVRPKNLVWDGTTPTMMVGYGGFGVSLLPHYDDVRGRAWLAHNGIAVFAHVRGGGELGEKWHVTGPARQHTYEDFIAVAEDLIRRKITSPQHLGMEGFSAGGLLVANVMLLRPDLFKAVVIEAGPVYNGLGGDGGNNEEEFGPLADPTRLMFSPYHQLRPGLNLPTPLIYTNRTDTRVPPWQGRAFAYKMSQQGYDLFYFEGEEGGHTIGASPEALIEYNALKYSYLRSTLGLGAERRQQSGQYSAVQPK